MDVLVEMGCMQLLYSDADLGALYIESTMEYCRNLNKCRRCYLKTSECVVSTSGCNVMYVVSSVHSVLTHSIELIMINSEIINTF